MEVDGDTSEFGVCVLTGWAGSKFQVMCMRCNIRILENSLENVEFWTLYEFQILFYLKFPYHLIISTCCFRILWLTFKREIGIFNFSQLILSKLPGLVACLKNRLPSLQTCQASNSEDLSKVDSVFLIPHWNFSVSNSSVILETRTWKYSWTSFSLSNLRC